MKANRILALLAALFLMISLTACGKKEAQSGGTSQSSSSAGTPDSDFPDKTITLICPYGAGGGTDVIMRALANSASKIAGVNIIVQNVTGGNGATGVVTMMSSKADGYTVGSCQGEWISLEKLGLAPPDFDYNNAELVMHYNFDPACYIVPIDSPYNTIGDLVTAAKAAPGSIVLGVTAAGGAHHLATLLFENKSGAEFNVIPYSDGASAVLTALLSNQVEVASVGPAEAAAQVDAGKAKILAVCSENHLDKYPDVPTMTEEGYEVVYGSWRGLAVPSGTPTEIVQKLEQIFYEAAQTDEFKQLCAENGFTIDLLNKEEFQKRFQSQEELIDQVCEIYTAQLKG
ncbi:MAG: tripartite tricarboxylate transporter substrate binding protein [Bacillota bacterium]